MPKRTSYQIKKRILLCIKDKEKSPAQIQRKLSTNFNSIKNNCKELEEYGLINIRKIEKDPSNHHPSSRISITEAGIKNLKKQ